MGSRGDSSEQKLIEQILEDSRAGTLARIIDHSDSNKDREQLVKNLGAIVIARITWELGNQSVTLQYRTLAKKTIRQNIKNPFDQRRKATFKLQEKK